MKLESRKTKTGTVYRIRFCINYNPFRTPWVDTPEKAKDLAAELRSKVKNNQVSTGAEIKLFEFAKLWLEKHAFVNKVYSAALRDEQHLRIHVLPVIGKIKLRNLTEQQLIFLFNDLRVLGNLSIKSINNILGTVKKMLNDAVRWRYLNYNPANCVQRFKGQQKDMTIYTHDEIQKILMTTHAKFPYEYELIVFALNTGCRLGECLALRWSKVDFERKFATISATYDAKRGVIAECTKSKQIRRVPLNTETLTLLKQMVLKAGDRGDNLVFPNVKYNPMTYEKRLQILKASGCSNAINRGANFHSFRHTFASEFMRKGGNLYELQKILGHQSLQQTERYAHFVPDYLAGVTEIVSFSHPASKVIPFSVNQ